MEAAERTRVEYSSGRLLVKTSKPRGLGNYIGVGRAGSVDVTIELPADSRIQADAGFADFRGAGRLGDIRVKIGTGDIRLDQTGQLHIDTGAGNAAAMVAEGVDVKTAQVRLGHSDPRLTLAIYAEATTEADRSAADKLGTRLMRLADADDDSFEPAGSV
ncbi:MAG: hypothetical protein ACRDWS_04685 [Acidimicrobiia bacterium]